MSTQQPGNKDHDTEILTEDQITEGPTEPGDRPWRNRLGVAQGWQTLLAGVSQRWPDSDLDTEQLSRYRDDPDGLVDAVAEATDRTTEAVENEFDEITRS